MYCLHCGSEVPEKALFCMTCGGKIEPLTAPEESVAPGSKSSHSLPAPKGRRIAIIVGIVAASVILLGALIFGGLSLFAWLQNIDLKTSNENTPTSEMSVTDETGVSDSAAVSDTEVSETEVTVATLSQNEIDTATFTQYIADTLVPAYGTANLDMFLLDCSWWAGFMDLREFMPNDRKGIVSTHLEDLNGDGNLELLVVIAGTFATAEVHTNDYDDYVYETHYDGVEIKVFTISGGTVQEMLCDNREMKYSDVFMYAQDESVQVSVLDNSGVKYIYVYKYSLPVSEQSSERFLHDIYQVTNTGIHCVKSMITINGIIYNGLDATSVFSNGTETFSIWSGDSIGDYYHTIRGNLTPYGLDCSFMDAYYDVIQVDTEWNQTFSRGMNHSYTPLSALISNIQVIAMAGGDCEYDPDHGVTTQSYFLLNLTAGPLAQTVRVIPFSNAQVESAVTVIRDLWTQDRNNIAANLYTIATVAPGIVSYHNGTEIVMIEIAGGTGGIPYARTYEYVGGQLIFAFLDSPGTGPDQRLYFDNNILFRWRFTDGTIPAVNYDNAVAYAKFIKWERKALEEGLLVLTQAN